MKYKVITTPQVTVLVDESADITRFDYLFGTKEKTIYTPEGEETVEWQNKLFGEKTWFKIIATINHSISLNVPMVRYVEWGKSWEIINAQLDGVNPHAYSLGWLDKAAQQKGAYSEEDLKNALHKMYSIFMDDDIKSKMEALKGFHTIKQNIIQSLNQKYIELETEHDDTVPYPKTRIKTNRVDGQLMAYVKQ